MIKQKGVCRQSKNARMRCFSGMGAGGFGRARFFREGCLGAEEAFDAEAFVSFGHALATAEGADFELSGVDGDGEVGDEGILGLA